MALGFLESIRPRFCNSNKSLAVFDIESGQSHDPWAFVAGRRLFWHLI